MTAAMRRAPFQQAAVDHIVERLRDRRGSRRFLLADEVGLGKTIVARGVIEELARRRPLLRVIYLCSNAEIAEQNRKKLDPEADRPVGRVTQLALAAGRAERTVLLYSFTPGTSLREGTGLSWERKLILYLLRRIYDEGVREARWRNYFRCGVKEDSWREQTKWKVLQSQFERKTTVDFQQALRRAWSESTRGPSVIEQVREHVATFDDADANERTRRNQLVAELRKHVQRVALTALEPDLVILDEVQRFRDVLDHADDDSQLTSELFRSRAPVLILSATPYRLLTLDHEIGEQGAAHHEDFFTTLRFLFDRDVAAPVRIKANLERFAGGLRETARTGQRHDELLSIKRALEEDLRKVVCRTERSGYAQGGASSVEERGIELDELPSQAELTEYFAVQSGLSEYLDGHAQVTEFWKSAPSLLTFLDAGYALLRRLRDAKASLPRSLLSAPEQAHQLAGRNQRMRRVVSHALGQAGRTPQLWAAPSYTYHRDQFFGDEPLRKLLVFSGWRFVPKAVAVIASSVLAQRVGSLEQLGQPLRFSERRSFHVFDVCFPSPALAAIVNPRAVGGSCAAAGTRAEDLLASARSTLRARLAEAGVRVVPSSSTPLWRAVARLERAQGSSDALIEALEHWDSADEDDVSEAARQHRDWFCAWLQNDDDQELELSEARLDHLALVATCSPAVALLRAVQSVYDLERDVASEHEAEEKSALSLVARVSLGALRRYFNRPLVQRIVRDHRPRTQWPMRRGGEHGYAERVLLYACDAHLQAVLDEYVYLLRHASACSTLAQALSQLEGVWSLSQGAPRTNGAKGGKDRVRVDPDAHVHQTYFALAFGEDVARDGGPAEVESGRLRKSVVREAFNSPFWPFVLATTSVGQEGLDFHLYCRDIFHWNLPSNPVDLEQREGRINRRDCLAVRASIARDVGLDTLARAPASVPGQNPWALVFDALRGSDSPQRYKHGLYPNWIYECTDPRRTVRIQRHVAFFAASRDRRQYERLKTGLALYRLAFGQPNQEDLLGELEARLQELSPEERRRAMQRLAGYMINLSPVDGARARKLAEEEAESLLSDPSRVLGLLEDVQRLRDVHADALGVVHAELEQIVDEVRAAREAREVSARTKAAAAALVYLRNPYDQRFDGHVDGGFDDDVEVIRAAAKANR